MGEAVKRLPLKNKAVHFSLDYLGKKYQKQSVRTKSICAVFLVVLFYFLISSSSHERSFQSEASLTLPFNINYGVFLIFKTQILPLCKP